MCLAIDGVVFCDVLRKAPLYEGESLERVEHNLEENKRPYTDEVEAVLAEACGLSREVYRDRITRIRGKNVLMQLEYHLSSYGPYFVFPKDYIEGISHEVPRIPCITAEAQEAFEQRLPAPRFAYFCKRVDRGITQKDLHAYPEHDRWIVQFESEHLIRQYFTKQCRLLLANGCAPSREMYYPRDQLQKVLQDHTRWFHNRKRLNPPLVIRALLEPEDESRLKEYLDIHCELKARKPTRKQGTIKTPGWRAAWRNDCLNHSRQFLEWKRSLQAKYLPLLEIECFQRVTVPTEPLREAA